MTWKHGCEAAIWKNHKVIENLETLTCLPQESLFSLTQMIFMISWGRISDKYGRKPVLVYSVIGVSIMTCLFGFSKSMWQIILFRCLAGVFSGTIV
jgi:sugar phosphate permease